MDSAALRFDFVEYIAFILMLSLSILIGIYFGCKKDQSTVSGYLLGGKKMTVFPIIMSLVSTNISGITLLGMPTEVYVFGTQYVMSVIPSIAAVIFNIIAIMPVFYNLQLISVYEYLEMRFNSSVRIIVSIMYIIGWLTYAPTVIYGPGLALNQVSGMNVHVVTPVVSIICIIYTTLGGLKAVVWSDTLQGSLMIGSVILVMFLGIQDVGGITNVFKAAAEGDRLEFFNLNPDPTTRVSFWSATVGVFSLNLLSYSCSPSVVQRFISLPTIKEARKSAIGLSIGGCFFVIISAFTGLIIYAKYRFCNPLETEMINRPDQILPLFVIEIAKKVRGLAGLFMAGIVCAALSTLSTGLNTLSGNIYEDFIEPRLSTKPSEQKASLILKGLSVLIGVVAVSMVALIERLGHLVEVSQGFGGMTTGTMLGIFLLGLFVPFANTKGVLTGSLVSVAVMFWLMLGHIIASMNGLLKHATKPMSTEMCQNITVQKITNEIPELPIIQYFPFYKVTVFYFSLIGCLIVLLIGIVVSLLTGGNKDKQVDLKLISPIVVKLFNIKNKYSSVQLKTVN